MRDDALAAFHARYASLFGRREARHLSAGYLRGLLATPPVRYSAEAIAARNGVSPRAVQRFLTESPWSAQQVIDALQRDLDAHLTAPDGAFVAGEIAFPKQGNRSAGVARQPTGPNGRVINCQIGVFLAYVSSRGRALIDARLYLPKDWVVDRERHRAAAVPAGMGYRPRHELAVDLIRHARLRGGLSGDWVAAGQTFGLSPLFRDAVDAAGWSYVVDVPTTTPVFSKATVPQRGPAAPPPRTGPASERPVRQIGSSLAAGGWHELSVETGLGGCWPYRFAVRPIQESRDGVPAKDCWLIVRRHLDGQQPRYFLSNAAVNTSLATVGQIGAWIQAAAPLFDLETSLPGLAAYEGRSWPGWHHHVALALLAGAFVVVSSQ